MFRDRSDAGKRLAEQLRHLRADDVVVVGLPRGGVPVAYEVALELGAPLDVIVVRKLGLPFQPEVGMGAIGEGGVRVLNSDIVRRASVTDDEIATVEARERTELNRRARRYRAGRADLPLAGRVVVVVDDGIATGSTAKAACRVARAQGARQVILAVPVAPSDWTHRLTGDADDLVSLTTPRDFSGVGQFYRDFSQTTDEEVMACLVRAANRSATTSGVESAVHSPARDEDVRIEIGRERLGGHLTIPINPKGVVVFAHGSSSSRHSPRNRHVASVLNQAGLATLLFDLLTADEEHDRAVVFNIDLLGHRLDQVTQIVQNDSDLEGLPVAYFGASTGAAAALRAAAVPGSMIASIVSRGGRPDLAGSHLGRVRAPTLLIVGGNDPVVLSLNQKALARIGGESRLEVIPGATHLFEEPGTLQMAAELAREWFLAHLAAPGTAIT